MKPKALLFEYIEHVALVAVAGVSVRLMRRVLDTLCSYADSRSWDGAFPAVSTIAAGSECSVRAARRALRALEDAGIIVTEVGGGRKSSRYRIVRPAQAAPVAPPVVAEQPGHAGRGSFSCISLPPFGRKRRPAAASNSNPNPKRIKKLPEDLRPLADALTARNLRAAFSLTVEQLAEVRRALAEHGVPALVRAAYNAHRATDPARWWSAWLGLWSGLTAPSRPAPASGPAPDVPPRPDRDPVRAAVGAAAARAALATARR
ncbi:helix-turn-helix domain-containing protein [Frankia sp. AgB32]|uniref:helix-turn-helix domain-containing protein n=1 Tax=Frankia sp. AgB32 TaxID=631119 RepID=UPI00200C9802|nr:helix-turn-helix domain-containing protein [Frankia sp. AgB32]MCK9898011.1 helix-turn-helix domain-containing protein [Frankia sp. AgB32]